MRFHCDNPTCSAFIFVEGARDMPAPELVAELAGWGWSYAHNSVKWVATCPRCIRDLVSV